MRYVLLAILALILAGCDDDITAPYVCWVYANPDSVIGEHDGDEIIWSKSECRRVG